MDGYTVLFCSLTFGALLSAVSMVVFARRKYASDRRIEALEKALAEPRGETAPQAFARSSAE